MPLPENRSLSPATFDVLRFDNFAPPRYLRRPGQNGGESRGGGHPILISRITLHAGIPPTKSPAQIAVQGLRPDQQQLRLASRSGPLVEV